MGCGCGGSGAGESGSGARETGVSNGAPNQPDYYWNGPKRTPKTAADSPKPGEQTSRPAPAAA